MPLITGWRHKVKTRLCSIILTLILGISLTQLAIAQPACSASSRLTDDDARILLYVTPAAVDARKAGTDIDIEKSEPSTQFPANDFFVAALVSQKPTGASVLGNGILGYFAVNKRTGEVESTGDFTTVKGKELDRVRTWLLRAHCGSK
jgi:hypothetical protein